MRRCVCTSVSKSRYCLIFWCGCRFTVVDMLVEVGSGIVGPCVCDEAGGVAIDKYGQPLLCTVALLWGVGYEKLEPTGGIQTCRS